ncbi:hypothetical protein F2Q68_00026926 [Brassica cretica]|uniref:Uncharacterized protein n=1 Tax=Brassica cretica TaxID=69181 RepID=A0A8S9IEX6_BRACR|nr:hypothetical protein F2Q68_00026926 [Brassica cretica]
MTNDNNTPIDTTNVTQTPLNVAATDATGVTTAGTNTASTSAATTTTTLPVGNAADETTRCSLFGAGLYQTGIFVDFSRQVRSIALKNQLYAAVGAPLLTTIFFFSIKEVKHKVEEEEDKHRDDCELDLLYIVHSDISSLLHQEDPSLMTARVFSNAAANQSLQAPKQYP